MKTRALLMVLLAGMLLTGCAAPARPATPADETSTSTAPVGAGTGAYPTADQGGSSGPANPTAIVGTGIGPYPAPGTPEPGSTPAAPEGGKVVTLDNNGQTIHIAVGERFLIKLGEEYTWEVISSNQDIVRRVPNVMVVRGAQGLYEAHQTGQVELNATGDPACRSQKPACMMPSRLFTLVVVVN